MKSYFVFIIICFVSFNCSLTQEQFEKSHWDEKTNGPIPTFVKTKIDTLKPNMLPDSGAYYLYTSSQLSNKIININCKLRRLYVMGFKITMAWYRPPIGGCNVSETPIITTTMYPEFLLIRLAKPNEPLEKYNFRFLKKIKSLPCPYHFSYFLPEFRIDSTLN